MEKEQQQEAFELGKTNYLLLIAGVIVLAVGFIMMSGGGAENPNEFAGETLFNKQRLTIAPITVLIGFGIVLYGIIKKPQ